ncbi:MAG: YbaN family protein [Parabacteroides sp.]|uniref:DUF454 domain-containing protein n=2 Tax=Bacteroidales TaxID=171549 RepID=A0A1T4ZW00_9BACT|nr:MULTISPECIES: YbaN family protein [Bacteroidales]MBP7871070.1 YbaN family protein [Parabacteroides sp.]MDT3367161.1 YbaN family protein [Bacteroidota bacterium]OCW95796.1 hypothetical protein A9168_00415 [Macellibacteroides sp. HH-ZS]MBP8025806.1 YbaN family protein [Parabacteroides sp.]MDD3255160.1 YbaN family protein [Parabacteroides sp.]
MSPEKLKKTIYIAAGTLCLILGGIGIVLPLLPTTPFWLLTCWFYLRSSQTLYNRVMQNKRFGSYVRGFLVDKSISLRAKVLSIGTIWVSAIFTFALLQVALWLKMLLFVIFLSVSWYILSFPTKKKNG